MDPLVRLRTNCKVKFKVFSCFREQVGQLRRELVP